MVYLIKDPKGETVMGASTTANTAGHAQAQLALSPTGSTSQQEEIAQLKQRLLELEREMQIKEKVYKFKIIMRIN